MENFEWWEIAGWILLGPFLFFMIGMLFLMFCDWVSERFKPWVWPEDAGGEELTWLQRLPRIWVMGFFTMLIVLGFFWLYYG